MPFAIVFFERKNPVPQLSEDVNRDNEGGGAGMEWEQRRKDIKQARIPSILQFKHCLKDVHVFCCIL